LQGAWPGHGLATLRALDSYCFPGAALPETFAQLTALQWLSLREGDITALPQSFGRLAALQSLDLARCMHLTALPESFGCLAALQTLDLSSCMRLTALPQSFGRLAALQSLTLWGCKSLAALPDLRVGLRALRKLDIRGCTSLVAVPAFNEHPRLQVTYDAQHLEGAAGDGTVSHAPSLVVPSVLGSPMQLRVPPYQRCRAPSLVHAAPQGWTVAVVAGCLLLLLTAAETVICGGGPCPPNGCARVHFELFRSSVTDMRVAQGR
jgi:hypothetical protein